jgi:hypothetical protein
VRFKGFCFFLAVIVSTLKLSAQAILAEWNFPTTPDNSLVDIASTVPNNTAATIYTTGATGALIYTSVGASTYSASCNTWTAGSGVKGWEVSISTIGCRNIDVYSKQRSSGTGPRDFRLQYKIGAGPYIDVAGALVTCGDNFTSGVLAGIMLPAVCENVPVLYLRWLMNSNTSVVGGTVAAGGTSRMDELVISTNSIGYYRTAASGKWRNLSIWEYSPDNIIPYVPADTIPTYSSARINIRNGHTVVIDDNNYPAVTCNFGLDDVYIEAGGELHLNSGYIYFKNGALADLNVSGIYMDSLTNVATPNALGFINWAAGATWVMTASGTIIKTRASSSAFYQNNYAGGISNIPAAANWILRKTGPQNPTLITASAYYPNLIFENQSGGIYITTGVGTFFSGNSTCNVLGNLEIRSVGINAIIVYDSILTNALIVNGDLIINASGSLVLVGDSIRLSGNLNVNGSMIYSTTSPYARQLNFAGGNSQQVNAGTGLIELYNAAIDKSTNHVTLNQQVTIFNRLYFANGLINTSNANPLVFRENALALGYNNSSFINGPCNKWGNAAFTFPVGKLSNVQPLAMDASAITNPFWTENFNNGCTSGCLASSYSSANGTWKETDYSPPGACGTSVTNLWFVSCAENGNAVGACGTGCGSNATLHIGSQVTSPVLSLLCPTGDCGAAYDPGGLCPLLGPPYPSTATDIMMESPTIDCSGETNITLSFNYIAGGDANDTASLWFYDGATWYWITRFTPLTCGGGQGQWRNFSIQVPDYADNNSGFQIAFRWSNNDDGAGQALSFAVDDIQLSALDIFQSEYFYANPQLVYGNNYQAGIHHISACEYWHLNRLNGLSNRQVSLTWDANSCGVTSMPDLRVARYDNGLTQWRNHGNGSTTGTVAAGTITSALISSTFGPYTLASVNGLNPLPVDWLQFNAVKNNKSVEISWQALIKPMHQYFIVQRSKDLVDIETLSEIKDPQLDGQIVSYSILDDKPRNVNYYRIAQIDYNGTKSFTEWKKVTLNTDGLNIWHSEGYLNFDIAACCNTTFLDIRITDMLGHEVLNRKIIAGSKSRLALPNLNQGVYVVKVVEGNGYWQQKLVLGTN